MPIPAACTALISVSTKKHSLQALVEWHGWPGNL